MSDCCSNKVSGNHQQSCSECGSVCKSVEMKTLYHHVTYPQNLYLEKGEYYYCPTKKCTVAYFSSEIEVPKQKLREFQNIQQGWLCYCFDISEAVYRSALTEKNSEVIKSFVTEKTREGECACEIRNPAGKCCLADFKRIEKEYKISNESA